MEAEGRRRLAEAFSGPVRIQRAVDMRYGEQIFEVNVPLGDVDLEAPDAMAEIVARFHKRHEELYTYAAPDQEVVLVNARLAVVGELPALPEEPALRRTAARARRGAGGASTWTAGARCRSTTSTRWRRGRW